MGLRDGEPKSRRDGLEHARVLTDDFLARVARDTSERFVGSLDDALGVGDDDDDIGGGGLSVFEWRAHGGKWLRSLTGGGILEDVL